MQYVWHPCKKYSINLLYKNAINYNIDRLKIKIKLVIIIYDE